MILGNRNEKVIFVFIYDEKGVFFYLFYSIARAFLRYLRGKVGFKNVQKEIVIFNFNSIYDFAFYVSDF
jgi:hypothetical protein